jgi:hypothetical protein
VAAWNVDAAALRQEVADALDIDPPEQRDALQKRPPEIRVDPVCERLQIEGAHAQARWLIRSRS